MLVCFYSTRTTLPPFSLSFSLCLSPFSFLPYEPSYPIHNPGMRWDGWVGLVGWDGWPLCVLLPALTWFLPPLSLSPSNGTWRTWRGMDHGPETQKSVFFIRCFAFAPYGIMNGCMGSILAQRLVCCWLLSPFPCPHFSRTGPGSIRERET